MHPNRRTIITHKQAQEAAQRFTNLHFQNPGPKSRASIPAHESDTDILLFDYVSQQETLIAKLAESLQDYMKMASDFELSQFGVYGQAKDALEAARSVSE